MCMSSVHRTYFLKLLIEEIREAMARPKPRGGAAVTETSDGPPMPKPATSSDPAAVLTT
jgi:hypothetical protein